MYCGLADRRFLEVDHIDQDGASHRRKLGYGTTFWDMYKSLQRGQNDGWQLLCANCHAIKTWQHTEDEFNKKWGV